MQLPPGYSITVAKTNEKFTDYVVKLIFEGTEIGKVRVQETSAKCANRNARVHETHSNLDVKHRNKGLGLAMYSAAIEHGLQNGYTVVSSWNPSAFAQRVWCSKRLDATYHVSKFAKRWWISRKRLSDPTE